jgi:predicted metalloendopeptidase
MGELAEEGSPAPLFRFGVQQDEKDSSKQIASIGQAGLSLPDRDYYIVDSKRFDGYPQAICRARDQDVHAGRRHS